MSFAVAPYDPCPCGSGKKFKFCCAKKVGHGKYPLGTLAMYGPDDKTTTKLVAAVFKEEGSEPILERWVGTKLKDDPKVTKQIQDFFARHMAKHIIMTDSNMGCPHEEGEDFPDGGDCPFCPFWAGKQGSARRD